MFTFIACKSEGPAQVFLLVLVWMMAALRKLTREERQKVVLSYDKMCHLDNLRMARKPLPLPGDLQYMWLDINKIIDTLHISNHKDQRYHDQYHPIKLKEENPSFNTMSCEQTFDWSSRSKKILAAMQKKNTTISIYIVWSSEGTAIYHIVIRMGVDQYNLKLKTTLNPHNNMSTSFLTVTVPVFLV